MIELVRDAWKQLLQADRDRARRLVERWRTIPYPVFRRLCFYAMAESDLYSPQDSLNCLLEDDSWWLWSINVYREKFRLLDAIWPALSDEDADRLTSAILTGPPRAMFREDISDERFAALSEREVWLHLAKLRAMGRDLPWRAAELLEHLSTIHPEWRLAEGDRNEFTMWMQGGVGEPPVEKEQEFINLADDTVPMPGTDGLMNTCDASIFEQSIHPASAPARDAGVVLVASGGHAEQCRQQRPPCQAEKPESSQQNPWAPA